MKNLAEKVKKLPDLPGVYYFKQGKKILYIGKATSLKDRVRSYFPSTALGTSRLLESRGSWINKMLALVDKIDFKQTDSVLEALILESAEIKKHQPPYNTREKDDRSYLYITITKEEFPRVLAVRGSELKLSAVSCPLTAVFGPFPHGAELREALKIIRKIFPYRDACTPCLAKATQGKPCKPCFNVQLGLCPGVCSGAIDQANYARTIRHLKLFFAGKKVNLIKELEREMKARAKNLEFEKAGELKRQIFALKRIQDVALIKYQGRSLIKPFRIEAYDIAHLSGQNTVGAMTVMQGGELSKKDYRKFELKGRSAQKSDDAGNLKEILERRFNHPEWPWPNLIVVDGGRAQINVARQVLKNHQLKIPVAGVVKDERHKARAVLDYRGPQTRPLIMLNAEAHRFALAYHRKRRGRVL